MTYQAYLHTLQFQAGVGDPTLLGWLTTFGYLLAAVLCAACAWQADRIFADGFSTQHKVIWGGLSLVLLLLGMNKQLDLQTWFIRTIRSWAMAGGWFEYGQRLQEIFIIGFTVASLVLVLWIGYRIRHIWHRYWLLLFGLLVLARYILVRTASFYGVPLPRLSVLSGGFRINWLLEFAGILLIAVAAILNLRRGWLVSKRPPGTVSPE